MAIENSQYLELLRTAFFRAGGRYGEFPFREGQISRSAKVAMDLYRFAGEHRLSGYSVSEAIEIGYERGTAWRDFYNSVVQTQFRTPERAGRHMIHPMHTALLVSKSKGHTPPTPGMSLPGQVTAPVAHSMPSDHIAKLRELGWLTDDNIVQMQDPRGPQKLGAKAAADQIRRFTSNFFPGDIDMMPSEVSNQVEEWLNTVEDDVFGREVNFSKGILQARSRMRENEYDALTNSTLTYQDKQRLRAENRELSREIAELSHQRRQVSFEAEQTRMLRDRVIPGIEGQRAGPVRSLRAHTEALRQLAEDPNTVGRLDHLKMMEGHIRSSFKRNQTFFRNFMDQAEGVAQTGALRGMSVTTEMMSPNTVFYDETLGRSREFTVKELEDGYVIRRGPGNRGFGVEQIPIEELRGQGHIHAGRMVKMTPSKVFSLENAELIASDSIQANVDNVDALRRMDRRVPDPPKSIAGRRRVGQIPMATARSYSTEEMADASDELMSEVSRKLGSVFGFNNEAYDGPIRSDVAEMYRKMVGDAPLSPENLAKNLYAQILYGNQSEAQTAHRALRKVFDRKDDLSKATKAVLTGSVTELAHGGLPSLNVVQQHFATTARERGTDLPLNREGYNTRRVVLATKIQQRQDNIRRIELGGQSQSIINQVAVPQQGLTSTTDEVTTRLDLGRRVRQDMRLISEGAKSGQPVPQELWAKLGLNPIEGQAGADNMFRRLFRVEKQIRTLTDAQIQILSRTMSERNLQALIRTLPNAEPDVVENFYRSIQPYVSEMKAERAVVERTTNVARVLRNNFQGEYLKNIFGGLMPPEMAANFSEIVNPFEGEKQQVISRLYTMAEDKGSISVEGKALRLERFVDQGDGVFELTLLDKAGIPRVTSMSWADHDMNAILSPDTVDLQEIRESMGKRIRVDINRQLGIGKTRKKSGRPVGDLDARAEGLYNDAMAELDTILDGSSFEDVSRILGGRGSFVKSEVATSVFVHSSRLAMAADMPSEVSAIRHTVGESLLSQINYARGGFGDASNLAQVANQSLFEFGPSGELQLAREFAPRTKLASGAIARLDEVSDEARTVIAGLIETLSSSLQERGYDLADLVRASDEMRDIEVSSSTTGKLMGPPGEYGFRTNRGRLPPLLGAGARVDLPPSFFSELGPIGEDAAQMLLNNPVHTNQLPTLGELFAQAAYGATGGVDDAGNPVNMGHRLSAISEAVANQADRYREHSQRLPPEMLRALYPNEYVDEAPSVLNIPPSEVAKKQDPMSVRKVAQLFRETPTLRNAAIGTAAFMAWGVVQSRRKRDHAAGDTVVPNMPGGSPMSQSTSGPSSVNAAPPSAAGGGELYYITAHGSFDPAGFQNQVQGITGGQVYGTINSRPSPMQSTRPSVEERLRGY